MFVPYSAAADRFPRDGTSVGSTVRYTDNNVSDDVDPEGLWHR